ncbi:MAG: hypothetical protein UY18_C0001G0036 [Microgenomates group bacterium GW2011_GWF2_47_9]|nr:MAG: hypothetical protein UY18_C0001G0036 [Microgenomates group bacterium GW2011_GWF2_47_9]
MDDNKTNLNPATNDQQAPGLDPQKLVDEALSTSTPVEPVVAPNPPTPPIEPAIPQETKAPEAPLPVPSEVVPPELLTVKVSDDLPLAFAPKVEPTVQATPEVAPPLNPPVPPTQAGNASLPPKKKSNILGILIGFFLLLGGVVGGYYAYTYLSKSEVPSIANVEDWTKDQCQNGCSPKNFKTKWVKDHCIATEESCDDNNGDGEDDNAMIEVACDNDPATTEVHCDCDGKPFCIKANNVTCNQAKQIKGCGITVGAGCSVKYVAPYTAKMCSCYKNKNDITGGPQTIYFDRTGWCDDKASPAESQDSSKPGADEGPKATTGLCALFYQDRCAGDGGGGGGAEWGCDNNGCWVNNFGPGCYVKRYSCPKAVSGSCQQGGEDPAKSYTFNKDCGKQQIDVYCDGADRDFRTKIYPADCGPSPKPSPTPSPKPSPTPKPTIACASISKAPTGPKLGESVTVTCKGTVSPPTTILNLTYQFRYRVGKLTEVESLPWIKLTANADKATFVADEPGVYQVQCRTCAKIGMFNVCEPKWGATPL